MLSQYKLCLKESVCWGTIVFLSIDVQTRLSFQAIFKGLVEASPPCGQCCVLDVLFFARQLFPVGAEELHPVAK